MTKIEHNELNTTCSKEPDGDGNGGILVLAEAVLTEPVKAHLSLEETAEELLALASEASLSSPINRETIQTPLEYTFLAAADAQVEKPNTSATASTSKSKSTTTTVSSSGSSTTTTNTTASSTTTTNTTASNTTGKHVCNNCAATSTPFWRKSADGLYYCNACGLYLRTHNAMRPLSLSKNRESRRGKTRPELCGNCGATDTPMWRKTEDGMVVCNACGLYHKLHGQHRRTGTKKKEESLAVRKPVRSSDFTMVRENSQIAAKASASSAQNSAKYSLDNQYHHKFDPNRISNSQLQQHQQNVSADSTPSSSVLPVVEVQPVDARKLAYLKCPQGRTALLAPKLPQDQLPPNTPNPFIVPSPMPPILTSFINSLATTSPDDLTVEQVEHPLQPLLTSIVSQKLREQRNRYQQKSISPVLQTPSSNSSNIPIPMQIYHHQQQQQQQQQENFNQLAEFIQNQQQAIYNQQMIQQAIYNHVNENDNDEYGGYNHDYVNYQQQSEPSHISQYGRHQNIQNMNIQQLPQIQLSQMLQIQETSLNQQSQQQQQYFTEQFPEPPLRQLSPFSGIKFDKNLIDLVNMQFWQDNNGNQDDPSHQDPF